MNLSGKINELLARKGFYGSGQAILNFNKAKIVTLSKYLQVKKSFCSIISTHHLEKRIMIQSLFYTLIENSDQSKEKILLAIGNYLTAHQNSEIVKYKNKCEAEYCTITLTFCEQQKCEDVDMPKIERPDGALISEKSAKRINLVFSHTSSLLWSDLEGQPKATNVKEWLISNKFGCSGKFPY